VCILKQMAAAGFTVIMLAGCATTEQAGPEASPDGWVLMDEAYRYEQGLGVERDLARAFALYRQAARSGLPDAQYQLGLMYELGIGVDANIHEAQYWYQRAIDQGFCPGELRMPGDLATEPAP